MRYCAMCILVDQEASKLSQFKVGELKRKSCWGGIEPEQSKIHGNYQNTPIITETNRLENLLLLIEKHLSMKRVCSEFNLNARKCNVLAFFLLSLSASDCFCQCGPPFWIDYEIVNKLCYCEILVVPWENSFVFIAIDFYSKTKSSEIFHHDFVL